MMFQFRYDCVFDKSNLLVSFLCVDSTIGICLSIFINKAVRLLKLQRQGCFSTFS